MLAGDHVAAEAELRSDFDALWAMGERNYVATTAALLADALYRQGRLDDAARYAGISRDTATEGDVSTHVLWRAVDGKVLARTSRLEAGLVRCREAVALVESTDDVNTHADVLCDLAEAVARTGDHREYRRLLEQALELYRGKGNLVGARRVLAAL
jgi:tetratricopeptide (TPR) repeat protein